MEDLEERKRSSLCLWRESLFERIPEHIFEDILLHLPNGKTMIQCGLVCKRWYSIISILFRRYRKFKDKKSTSNSFTLLFQWHVDALENPEFPVLIVPPNTNGSNFLEYFIPLKPMVVVGSCHDLLLVNDRFWNCIYYVVNPVVRQWTPLAHPPRLCYPHIRYGMSFKSGFLWDYVNVNHNNTAAFVFKIIRISTVSENEYTLPGLDTAEFWIQIYCSGTNTWSEYTVDWYPFRQTHYLMETPIISHNGMFHWLNGSSLLSLNPFDLRLNDAGLLTPNRIIQLPESNLPGEIVPRLVGFGVSQGHLRVITKRVELPHQCVNYPIIWELDETKIGDANANVNAHKMWYMVYKEQLSAVKVSMSWSSFKFLAFHPYEGEVIFVQIEDSIYKFNLRTNIYNEFNQHKPYKGSCWVSEELPHLPPLVHPWFPTLLESESSLYFEL